jgi:hypothetical protein
MRRRAASGPAWIALAALALLAPAARAATKLEGDFQMMMDLRKNDRPYLWEFDSNSYDVYNLASFRLFSQPRTGIESYMKFEAAYNPSDNNYQGPQLQYREAHLRFRREFGQRGVDSYVFSRQDRFFVNTFLIPWVYGRGDAQGIRLDTWGFGKTNATFIAADRSGEFNPANFPNVPHLPIDSIAAQRALRTSDQYVLRLRREFLKDNALRTGLTWTRFEGWAGQDSVSGASAWNSILGFDSRWRVRGADVSFEYGESRDDQARSNPFHPADLTVFKRSLGFRLPDRAVAQAEIRSLKLGTPRLGYLNVTPGWWSRAPEWANDLGGPNSDQTGFYVNSWYLLPERAVTYSNSVVMYSPSSTNLVGTRQFYNELYIEFINGFTGKTAYRMTEQFQLLGTGIQKTTYDEWFNELQVESRLAWMRVQTKLNGIGTPAAKQLFVIETSINLTPRTKVYDRFAFGNDPSILRKGVFVQLQYRPTGNMEAFLQYGPDYIGGGSMPVDEGNLNGSADQKDIVKFILKGSF